MLNILIVDDSWLARRAVKKVLTAAGYECLEAESGVRALEILENESIDCIFLDLLMEGMSGFDVLKVLDEKGITIPAVIVSADIQETSRKQCYELGAFGFLNKPASEEDLLNKVKEAIDSRMEN